MLTCDFYVVEMCQSWQVPQKC